MQLLDVRVALGLGGKGYALMTGDVAAVNAAVEAGSTAAARKRPPREQGRHPEPG